MRALIRVSALALALSSAAVAARDQQTEARQVGPFDAVAVHAGIRAQVAIGGRAVEVTADPETLRRVVTEVKDGVLEIGFERSFLGLHLFNEGEVVVHVSTERLRAVAASGGARAQVAGTTEEKVRLSASGGGSVDIERLAGARELELSASGGATIHAAGIDAKDLIAGGSGGAVLSLAGRAEEAELSFSGGTVIKGQALALRRAVVQGSGGGEASARIADAIQGELSGGATLRVEGNPEARVRTSGGGEVVYAGGRRAPVSQRRGRRDDPDEDDDD